MKKTRTLDPRGESFQLCLCDLDGTLAHSLPLLYASYALFLRSFAIPPSQAEFKELTGHTLTETVQILKERYALPGEPRTLYRRYIHSMNELYPSQVEADAEGIEFLKRGRQEYQWRCWLVTSASRRLAHGFLREHGLENIFSGCVTSEDVLHHKPAPDPYLLALEQAGLEANVAFAIEDSSSGVASALAAGLTTYWLSSSEPEGNEWILNPRLIRLPNWHALSSLLFQKKEATRGI